MALENAKLMMAYYTHEDRTNCRAEWMKDDGKLLIEHGFNQRKLLSDFAISEGLFVLEQIDDFSGLPRVLVLAK